MAPIGLLTLHFQLNGCRSLKDKRSQIKPLLARLHREFNVSAAEVDLHDSLTGCLISCCVISTDTRHNQQVLHQVLDFCASHFPEFILLDHRIEQV
ncbi:MAG TPA: DUF503 domain-containing protein [Anaerolineaceae bacterium]